MNLGVDFGTTRTVVAVADRGNYPVLDFLDHDGESTAAIPSMVAARKGELRYGLDAAAVVADPSFTVVRSFKRLFASTATREVRIGETTVPLATVLVGFFEHVRDAVLTRSTLPKRRTKDVASQAAVAVPANALGGQRLTTLDAFRRAGFDVNALLNEPSAAGFEYTHRHRSTLTSRRDLVIVYDLGGGTFDASAVRMAGPTHEVLATSGVPRLGGDDFDEVLARIALSQVGRELDALPARAAQGLLAQCRTAKEHLHATSRKVVVDLEGPLGALAPKPEVVVPVGEFYEACVPLVERTIEAMLPVMTRFEQEATAPDLADVAGIYVVGGGSELPIIGRALRERFGRRVHRSPYPSAAVAIGLAIAGDRASHLALVDRYARTFGVFRELSHGTEVSFDAIFGPDTALPARDQGPITRTRAYRAAHNVGHYRFFECSAFDPGGRPRGDMTIFADVHFPFDARLRADDVAHVPVARVAEEGPYIEERYSLDERGIVDVVIRNVDAGYERSFRLQ